MPILGLVANVAMLVTIFWMGFLGGGTSQVESIGALVIAGIWAVLSAAYVVVRSRQTGRPIMMVPAD